jgi:hypothetical protein
MSKQNPYTARCGPNYEKYAKVVINNLHNKGIDFATNTDAIEEEAQEVAEMLVLDVDELTEAAREEANSYQTAGVIRAGGQ